MSSMYSSNFQNEQDDTINENDLVQHMHKIVGEDYYSNDDFNSMDAPEEDEDNLDDKKSIWLYEPTKRLLTLVEEYESRLGKSLQLSSKKKMWSVIARQLVGEGYSFTVNQVQGKYRSLERRYKSHQVFSNYKNGRKRSSCPFQEELDRIIGKRTKVEPPELQSNSEQNMSETGEEVNKVVLSHEEVLDSGTSPRLEDPLQNSYHVARKKLPPTMTLNEKILKKVEEMQQERAKHHKKIIDFLQRREERAEKKLKLLETLVNQLNHPEILTAMDQPSTTISEKIGELLSCDKNALLND